MAHESGQPYEITNGGSENEPHTLKEDRNNILNEITATEAADSAINFFFPTSNRRLIPIPAAGGKAKERGEIKQWITVLVKGAQDFLLGHNRATVQLCPHLSSETGEVDRGRAWKAHCLLQWKERFLPLYWSAGPQTERS